MNSIDKSTDALYEINKSKFYSYAYPVFDVASVDKIIDDLHIQYKDATHICYACIMDSPKVERAIDDGEPCGTAGKPLLELLKKKKIDNTLVVVIRYFGGIKLGAGGLVRAYTTAGNMALDKARVVEFVKVDKYCAKIETSRGARLRQVILASGEILSERYEDKYIVEFTGEIKGLASQFKGLEIEMVGSELRCR